jgi:hypothetical protein
MQVGVARTDTQKHHVFPKNYLYQKYDSSNSIQKNMINEIANKAFITQKSNMKILDNPPSEYLPQIESEQLRKQFVPLDEELYKLENYELFLTKRRSLIKDGINEFLRSYYEYKTENIKASDLQHYDEAIERIELKLRDKIAIVLDDASEENAYKESIPSHIQQKVNSKIQGHLSRNPGERLEDYESLRDKLNFFDINEYKETIINKVNWTHFEEYFGKPGVFEKKIYQLGELRNSIRHSRFPNEVVQKEGEAAITWFESILIRN